jgi:AcrR family transcriptional regulator
MSKYHHGDLRGVLIAVATELLAEEGVHTLSLRKIAQKAGVSHNAPYMHFADKEAVLAAIAEEGFRLLSETVREAISQLGNSSTRQRLIAASTAYVNFAMNHLNHVQVMFYPYDLEKYPSLLEASQASLNHLFELVEVGQANGELTSDNPHTITKVIWAMVHGVTTLSTAYKTNILSPDSPLTEETISTFMDCLLDGLAI